MDVCSFYHLNYLNPKLNFMFVSTKCYARIMAEKSFTVLYRGLVSRGKFFVDWIVKTFHGNILEGKHHFTR